MPKQSILMVALLFSWGVGVVGSNFLSWYHKKLQAGTANALLSVQQGNLVGMPLVLVVFMTIGLLYGMYAWASLILLG